MGAIFDAAKHGEGRQLARESNITWAIVGVFATAHGIWRYFSGRPLLGDKHRKTHATWSEGSSVPLKSTQRPPGWWSCLAEKHRAAIRVGLLVIAIDVPWDVWSGPFSSLTHGLVTIAAFIIAWSFGYLFTKAIVQRFNNRKWDRGLVEPLKAGVGPIIGLARRDVKIRIPRRKTLGG